MPQATQATELDSLIPLQFGMTKLFLIGDPNQLPPTVLSTVSYFIPQQWCPSFTFINKGKEKKKIEGAFKNWSNFYKIFPRHCVLLS